MAQNWYNADGLFIQYGTDEAKVVPGGDTNRQGESLQELSFKITATTITTTDTVVDYNLIIPKGGRVHQVDIIAETLATSGGAATLNVGLQKTDHATSVSATGLVSALAMSGNLDSAGKLTRINVGSTGAGSKIGVTAAENDVISISWGTAAFTAGVFVIKVFWYFP